MADCSSIVLAGIAQACETNVGGIRTVYMTPYVAGAATVTSDEVSAIAIPSGQKWYKYEFRRNTGSLTSTLNVDETTGVNYVANELALVFSKMETAKRIEMAQLSIGHVIAVVEDCNGKFWMLGKDDYVAASAGTGATGTNKTDANAYNLTLASEEESYPMEVTAAAVETIKSNLG